MKRPRKYISPVTKISGNVQIFASPEARTRPLPEVEGVLTISFKHEDSYHGMAIGPVFVTVQETYDAWLKAHGAAHTNGRGETRYLVPFGAKPDGRHDLGWMTKQQALEVADHYGVTLEDR